MTPGPATTANQGPGRSRPGISGRRPVQAPGPRHRAQVQSAPPSDCRLEGLVRAACQCSRTLTFGSSRSWPIQTAERRETSLQQPFPHGRNRCPPTGPASAAPEYPPAMPGCLYLQPDWNAGRSPPSHHRRPRTRHAASGHLWLRYEGRRSAQGGSLDARVPQSDCCRTAGLGRQTGADLLSGHWYRDRAAHRHSVPRMSRWLTEWPRPCSRSLAPARFRARRHSDQVRSCQPN